MARNFPEIWIGRVENLLRNTQDAPWIDGIPELAVPVTTLNEGDASEKNLINLPVSDFEVDVLINNTTYPIALQEYDDDTAIIALDKYQSLATTLSDDQVIGAAYDKIDNATKEHVRSITSNKYIKAIHAIAPTADSAKTPVLLTTGTDDGEGRKILRRQDIVRLKKKFDQMMVPASGRRLVLCSDHVEDLLNNDQKFADQYYNYTSGKIANLMGFEVYEYVANPFYDAATNQKLSFGAIPGTNDRQGTVAFYAPNIAKKTGLTRQYFADSKTDPQNQTNLINYRHYFIAVPKRAMYIGAIVSASV